MVVRALHLVAACGAATLCAASFGQELLYDNGPIVTHPGDGPDGTDYSAIQTAIGQQATGWIIRDSIDYRVADDFVVPPEQTWQLESVSFSTLVGEDADLLRFMSVRIWDGAPNRRGSSVIWGDADENVLVENTFSGAYRGNDVEPRFAQRITRSEGAVSAVLEPGTYWIDFTADTSQFDGAPVAIPVNILGERGKPEANALWLRENVWRSLDDPNLDVGPVPQDIPFEIHGLIVPTPGTAALALAGLAVARRRVRIKPTTDAGGTR